LPAYFPTLQPLGPIEPNTPESKTPNAYRAFTVDGDGFCLMRRLVLLRFRRRGFVLFTNYNPAQGRNWMAGKRLCDAWIRPAATIVCAATLKRGHRRRFYKSGRSKAVGALGSDIVLLAARRLGTRGGGSRRGPQTRRPAFLGGLPFRG